MTRTNRQIRLPFRQNALYREYSSVSPDTRQKPQGRLTWTFGSPCDASDYARPRQVNP